MSFGKELKTLLEEHALTQSFFANQIGYTQRAVSKWINEQSEPTEQAIIKTASFFNVSADYLLGKTDDVGAVVSPIDSSDPREKELLSMFRQMNTAQQNRFLGIAEGMIEESKKNIRQ